ncbi:SH3 domain-containing protein [Nitrincola sp. MINF-07-Sa-05]|uniref:SH3 domain-containing protein n=1 Tax=Nitrincola salilacus TaxID=3400273 RepID=UPI003918022C
MIMKYYKGSGVISIVQRILFAGLLLMLTACTDRLSQEAGLKQGEEERSLRSMDDWATASVLNMHLGWNAPRHLGQLTYRAWVESLDRSPTNLVEQPFTLNGHLLAYWDIQYYDPWETRLIDAQPEKILYLRFYPQGSQDTNTAAMLEDLITLAEDSRRAVRFFIYDSLPEDEPLFLDGGVEEGDRAKIEALLKPFGTLGDGLMQDREGYAAIPVRVKLIDVVSFHDAASTFLYGQVDDIQPWPEGDAFYSEIYDLSDAVFLGVPWQQTFRLDSAASIHAQPSEKSEVVMAPRMQASDPEPIVEKISTYNADWYLVRLYRDPEIQGYVRVKDLWIVN